MARRRSIVALLLRYGEPTYSGATREKWSSYRGASSRWVDCSAQREVFGEVGDPRLIMDESGVSIADTGATRRREAPTSHHARQASSGPGTSAREISA